MRHKHSEFAAGTDTSNLSSSQDLAPTSSSISHVSSVFAPRLRNLSDPSSSLSAHHRQEASRAKNTVKLWKSELEEGVNTAKSEGREKRHELREKETQPLRTLSAGARGMEQRVQKEMEEERKRVSSRYPGTVRSNSGVTRNGTAQSLSPGRASPEGGWTTAFSEGHRHHRERSEHPHEHHHRREEPKEHHHHHPAPPEEHHSHSQEHHPREHSRRRADRNSEREDSEDDSSPPLRKHRGRGRARSAESSEESGEERTRGRGRGKKEKYRNSSDESGDESGSEDE